jgi:hypothetical protein
LDILSATFRRKPNTVGVSRMLFFFHGPPGDSYLSAIGVRAAPFSLALFGQFETGEMGYSLCPDC